MDHAQYKIQRLADALAAKKKRLPGRIAPEEAGLCMEVWEYLSKRGSLRSVARELGFSAAYLSDVSRCKRNVSAELLKRVLSLGQQVK